MAADIDDPIWLADNPGDDPTLRALKATRREYVRTVSRGKKVIAALLVSLVLDFAASGASIYALVHLNDVADSNRAAVIAACERSNGEGQKHIALWTDLLAGTPLEGPPEDATLEEREDFEQEAATRELFLADLQETFQPEEC